MTQSTSTQKITLITDENTPYFGVYSFEQEKLSEIKIERNGNSYSRCTRYNIYEKEDGTQVNVTEVSRNPNLPIDHKSRFDDSIFVGNVVKWVRTVLW
jgi:predicted Fe-Mo cluster-binding NifX family protein